ncbi:hypothetical protein CGLAMM_02230 [Acetobacteraceae bacterium EV16G]|uniref:AsmA-like C-terminal domain-containing protein n=1 Tax=Sorlinia euscelidii TaxID=3081148 RepID=A0ABU7U2A0_9PROT
MERGTPASVKAGTSSFWRRALYGGLVIAALSALGLIYLVIQFRSGPVDVTPIISRFFPISIERSLLRGPPAGRLSAARFRIGWRSPAHGLPSGFGVWADDLKIIGRDGDVLVSAQHAYMRLLPRYLLHKRFRPVTLMADHGFVKLRFFEDGDLDLDWPDARRHMYPIPPFSLRLLHELKIDHVSVSLLDSASGKLLSLDAAQGALSRAYTGHYTLSWDGALEGGVRAGPQNLGHVAVTTHSLPDGSVWQGVLPMQNLADLQNFLPPAASWQVPATLTGTVTLRTHGPALMVLPDSQIHLTQLDGDAKLGSGHIRQKKGPELALGDGMAAITATPPDAASNAERPILRMLHRTTGANDAARLTLSHLSLRMRGADGKLHDVTARGQLNLDHFAAPKNISGNIHAALPGPIQIPQLMTIWPMQFIPPVRLWVGQNLTQGRAEGLDVTAQLASPNGFDKLDIAGLQGKWHVRDATLFWRRPIPPGIHLDADLSITQKDALDIAFLRGWQTSRLASSGKAPGGQNGHSLRLKGGHMRINGLFDAAQMADLKLNLVGDLSGFINVLSEPELKLLKGKKLPFTKPSGQVDAQLALQFPLHSDAPPETFRANIKAAFQKVELQNLVLGQSVSDVSGHLVATQSRMALDAKGAFGPLPTQVHVNLLFMPKGASDQAESFDAQSVVTPGDLRKILPDAEFWFRGHALLKSHYAATEDGHASLQTSLDMQDAGISIPLWQKPPGMAAKAMAEVKFHNRIITDLPRFAVTGDNIDVSGWGQTDHGKISILTLNKMCLAGSSGTGRVVFPARRETPVDARLSLSRLDITPWLQKPGNAASSKAGHETPKAHPVSPEAAHWQASLRADDVVYRGRAIYKDLQFTSAGQGIRVRRGTLYAGGVSPLSAELTPKGQRAHLQIHVQNLGGSLENLAIYDRLEGGHLAFDGVTEGDCCQALPRMRGQLDVGAFNFRKPPRLLQTLAHAALVDWSKTNPQRFALDRLHAKLTIDPSQILIEDGYFGNRALGATLRGLVNLRQKKLDLHGTVIPAFGFNAILGRFPKLGHLFSPEKEGGVFAATYVITGDFKDPHLEANPFSVFLPGVIRSFNE